MHAASVLRDAVTNFEVYLEHARAEIRGDPAAGLDAAGWTELEAYFSGLGIAVDSADVGAVRELRHHLTHRRGELESVARRDGVALVGQVVAELDEGDVLAAMDVLGDHVRLVDPVVWAAQDAGDAR